MDASRVGTERVAESEQLPVAGAQPQPQADSAVDVVRQIIRTYGTDPAGIATGLNASGRSNDREVWMALQRTVGNSTTRQVRQMVDGPANAEAGTGEATATPEASTTANTGTDATATATPEAQANASETRDASRDEQRDQQAVQSGVVQQTELPAAPAERTVAGVRIVAPPPTRPDAVDACAVFINQLLGENEHAQRRMERLRVTLVIIPAATQMTDLPQFRALRGQQTFDGRDWSQVRGSGGMRAPDGSWAVGICEENLIDVPTVIGTAYEKEFSLGMHELAHTLHSKGTTRRQRRTIERLYNEHRQRDPDNRLGTWTDNYAAENAQEYFAQATNCFFGTNGLGNNHNSREWLMTNDRPMYDFLVQMYERHHDRRGRLVDDEATAE